MLEFNVLGNDNFHLAELFSVIFESINEKFIVNNIENIPIENTYEFLFDQVIYRQSFYKDWDRMASKSKEYILGVAQPKTKAIVVEFFRNEYKLTPQDYISTIHPTSNVACTAIHGKGLFVNPCSVIGAFSEIGDFVTISRLVSIGHHVRIKDYCKINPGANIASKAIIGRGVTIGMGANILNKISIGDNSFIGAGSLVTSNIPANVLAYGIPAKVIKSIE